MGNLVFLYFLKKQRRLRVPSAVNAIRIAPQTEYPIRNNTLGNKKSPLNAFVQGGLTDRVYDAPDHMRRRLFDQYRSGWGGFFLLLIRCSRVAAGSPTDTAAGSVFASGMAARQTSAITISPARLVKAASG